MWFSLLFCIGLFTSLNIEAQSVTSITNSGDFFEFLSINDLTDAEKTLAGLPANASGSSFDYIRFNSGESNAADGFYTVSLPLENNLLPSWIKIDYATQSGNRTGLLGEGEFGAFAVHFVENEGASGYGYTDTKHFSISPIDESLSEVTYSIVPTDITGTPVDAVAPNTPAEPSDQSTIECAATIDVLFLRTQGADDAIATLGRMPFSFDEMVDGTVDHTNLTLLNTQIGPKQIRAIIHPDVVPQIQYSDPGLPNDPTPCYGAMDVLKADQSIKILRQFYNADVVVYYVDQLASCGGIAGAIGVTYNDAYILNNVNAEIQWYNYLINNTHEIGHIFGGSHGRNHKLTQGTWDKYTMMKTGVDKGAKIAHYSNPDVDYTHPQNGVTEVTGAQSDDNSQFVISNFCRQADMESSGDFLAHIQARQWEVKQLCNEVRFRGTAEAGNTGGPNSGPYTYEWRISTNPGYPSNPNTIFSTLQNPVWTIPNANQIYYVWLNVTSASNLTTRVMTTVRSRCALSPALPDFFRGGSDNNDAYYNHSHHVEVNFSGRSNMKILTFQSSKDIIDGNTVVKLYNNTGQVVAISSPTSLDSKSNLLVSDNSPSGIYYLVLEGIDGSILQTKPISLVK